ncbi:MAG TPA: 50S ribosomal protein L23 [Candidatus Paceibacterota bacterium]|nr:50S ribosomal protein L23 [Candidatus Paceibacterota bacterium]
MATTKVKKNNKEEDKKVKTHPLIIGPRITEKSAIFADKGAYTFNVVNNATKNEIKKAVKMVYNVSPIKVRIMQVKEKVVVRRGVIGVKQGGKKAVVYLKKGDKIAFV